MYLTALILSFLGAVIADYQCLCNYHVEREVYTQTDSHTIPLGHLYEFDCKPTYARSADIQNWQGIQYEKQVAFVYLDEQVKVQTCPGDPPTDDLVIVTSTFKPATTIKTSAAPTTNIAYISARTKRTTSSAITTRITTTTPRPTIISNTTTRVTTTAKPAATQTTNSSPTTTSTTPVPHGDISKCPSHVRKDAIRTNGYLNQYGQYCFVLDPQADTWTNAEKHCTLRGGHLLTIRNAQEQEFFTNYLKSHHYVESVFIGLRDDVTEGTYTWASGVPVTYTNWAPDYNSPQHSHASDDCVVMRANGQWDDVGCGIGLISGIGIFEKHHFICQYGFDATLPSIFGAIGSIIGK